MFYHITPLSTYAKFSKNRAYAYMEVRNAGYVSFSKNFCVRTKRKIPNPKIFVLLTNLKSEAKISFSRTFRKNSLLSILAGNDLKQDISICHLSIYLSIYLSFSLSLSLSIYIYMKNVERLVYTNEKTSPLTSYLLRITFFNIICTCHFVIYFCFFSWRWL